MADSDRPPDNVGRAAGLAARFRRALSAQDEAQRKAAAAEEEERRVAQAARAQLLTELELFGREVGALTVLRRGDALTYRYRDREVVFSPDGDRDHVKVVRDGGKDEEGVLFRQPELDYRWVYSRKKRLREVRVPLYDAGVEDLLVNALGLPPPAAADATDEPPARGSGADRKL